MSWHKNFRPEAPRTRPVAVVDIGSNSIRLVVYDGIRRSPTPIFNEKVLCGLGKGVAITQRLSTVGVTRALAALRRFHALTLQMGVRQVFVVATAAVREAVNGEDFVEKAEEAIGAGINILTGKEEARYAALGVISGIPEANGIVGDLGGGSLELIDVNEGRLQDGMTLPLGALRLADMSGGSIPKARDIIEEYLNKAKLLDNLRGRAFYAVGGTWRNLARLHMAQTSYPLHVLHHYSIPGQQAKGVADLVARLSQSSLKNVREVSKSRWDTLPLGALVLERLLERCQPSEVIFSIFGVREGLLYSKLPRRKMQTDPLLASCWDFARHYARSPEHELELSDWTDQLFGPDALPENETERRLRYAACLLADIGWRAHPDYRAERSLSMISQAAFVGLDHPERVFLALTIFYRYNGESSDDALLNLLDEEHQKRAMLLSHIFRLAYVLSAAMPGMLPRIGLALGADKTLVLTLPKKLRDLMGERVEKRLSYLATEMGRTARIIIE